jgi:hypothetical protein
LAEFLPRNRFDLVTIALVATTYISLSPYYAAWTNHAHWWVYAGLGILNSVFFIWLGKALTEDGRRMTEDISSVLRLPSSVGFALFAAAVFASLLQPFIGDNGSPIRAPIIAAGMEMNALAVFVGMIMLLLAAIIVRRHLLRATDEIWTISVPLIFAPLFFSVYTLTKESTAIFEIALKALGV